MNSAEREANLFIRDLLLKIAAFALGLFIIIWLWLAASLNKPISEQRRQYAVEEVSRYLTDAKIVLDPQKNPGLFYVLPVIPETDPEKTADIKRLKLRPNYLLTLAKGCPPDVLCINDLDKFYTAKVSYKQAGKLSHTKLVLMWHHDDSYWAIYKDPSLR